MSEPLAYPLAWPAGWPRTPANERRTPRFQQKRNVASPIAAGGWTTATGEITLTAALPRLLEQLRLLGVDRRTVIISSNVEPRRDGLPRADRVNVADPGVAVYWRDDLSRQQECMAVDLYETVAGNIAAVAATLDAMRAIERHGGAQILKRAFQGFKALPASTTPALSTEAAAEVLARRMNGAFGARPIEQIVDMIVHDDTWARDAVRAAASKTHPDHGGRVEDFQLVQEAKRVLEAHHGVTL